MAWSHLLQAPESYPNNNGAREANMLAPRRGRYSAGAVAASCWLIAAAPIASAATETIVFAFKDNVTGYYPAAPLIKVGGKLYGTTLHGGAYGKGTVYHVLPDGSHHIVYSFQGGSDGANPYAGLLDVNGTLYGTTQGGGSTLCGGSGCGTIYAIAPAGGYAQLCAFQGGNDGAQPNGGLTYSGGTLYGSTEAGGGGAGCSGGCGTVYTVTPQGAETVLYAFQGGSDAAGPDELIAVGTTLYGVARGQAGTGCQSNGCGAVFSVTSQGSEKLLYAFGKIQNGGMPFGRLLANGNALYGTTMYGGPGTSDGNLGCGTVFRVTLSGAHKMLHAFTPGGDGCTPYAGLIKVGATFYGTTSDGGASGNGAVYSITPQGNEAVIYSFQAGSDGFSPVAPLLNVGGTLYGTTGFGGGSNAELCAPQQCGIVFSLTP
jgi:uncharacterized repeat protein (TIGR03803 family)